MRCHVCGADGPRLPHRSFAAWPVVAALFWLLLAAACGPTQTPDSAPRAPSATPVRPGATPSSPSATPAPAAEGQPPAGSPSPAPSGGSAEPSPQAGQGVALLARTDLAERLEIAPEAIAVRAVEAVTWPDASLGCPQPGGMYAQVLTPGYRVIVEAGERTYEYHTDETKTVVLCTEEGSVMQGSPVPSGVEPGLEGFVDVAKADLAQRLAIAGEQIEVLEARSVVWPDGSLGCPQPGMRYTQVLVDGALIRLLAGGKVYEYHSGGSRGPFLCEQPTKLKKDAPPKIDLLTP
jgi:hypothetical protein